MGDYPLVFQAEDHMWLLASVGIQKVFIKFMCIFL